MNIKGESRTKRRAVSAVLSGLLLFSMLFTVGTGYFMFVINGESQYTHTLANRAAGLQSQLAESLTITPASGASNHLVFTATNIGGAAANITDVFVVDPSGVTHTYGLGFGASNTTPALPGGVTPQKTSASYDTGITIVPGVYTMKVITHRGNAYTATYPPPPSTSFASATGSLTVDLSSFRWVQLTGTSSITQENYAPNCNAALCGAGFSSNVASGDTIVYAVGWANHAAPATPTDTRGDTFTLGASNTVSASTGTPPTLVQKNYNSNCASASCGLGFTSNVASGNTLAFALGWVNQNAPSTPTDTLGNTYTLGVSQSLTGTAPTLVQKNYNSNCASASCGLAFTSSVTAGDTLAFALGWYGQSPPSTPTDTRGDTFTLGVSTSVSASGGNPPTLVQKNYNSNCASASCGLAFTSNVAAGNTLVFGLGWNTVAQYYVPITLTNGQGSATPTTFQQQVTWNPSTYSAYESSTLSNIRFCADSTCAVTLNAWLESCTSSCTTSATSATAWVKLTSAIPASGGTTIYMVFQATTVGFDGNYWGEAPNLSATYGQYDNGANVFTAYFNGNTATSSFSVSSGYTLAKATGVTYGTGTISALRLTGYNGNNVPLVFNAQMSNAAMIGESNFEQNHLATDQGTSGFANNAAVASVLNAIGVNMGWSNEYFNQDYMSGGTVSNNWNGQGTDATAWLYSSTTYLGSSATTYTGYIAPQLYSSSGGYSGTVSVNPISSATNLYLGFVFSASASYPADIYYNWDRARAYPPSNVMPSTSFGGVGGGSSPSSITDTLGDAFTLGVSNSVAGNALTLVQKNYNSNCASASCGLAFTSNVAAGNTLVFGLGWYGGNSNVPITLTNSQGSATPTTFQQKVTWNPSTYSSYESSNLGNIRFCGDSACATTLNAWLESCTSSCSPTATSATAWVKLTSSIAGSGGTLTIYMVFQPTSVDFDGIYWGEAPNIPGTYGTNDNGANVFGKYWNFAGTSLPSGWTTTTGSPANNGLTLSAGAVYTTSTQFASLNNVLESYFRITSSTATTYDGMSQSNTQAPQGNNAGSNAEILYLTDSGNNNVYAWAASGSSASYNLQNHVSVFTPTVNQWYVMSEWVSSSQVGEQSNYGTAVTASGTFSTNQYIILGFFTGSTSGATSITPSQFQWVRVRALAPSNVMPSTSFGSVGGGNSAPSSITDTLGDSFTLGVSNSVVSGSYTYYSYIWYTKAASSGADTITATFSSSVTGSVSVYELFGATTTSPATSTGSSPSGSTSLAVTSFSPTTNSFVIGNAETSSGTSSFTLGSGYTLSGTCSSAYGCGEYQTGVGSATTVPFTLGASATWVESAISFAPTSYYSYIWYATAGSSGADTITASFSSTATGSVSVYEISGASTASPSTSTGSSSGGSTTASVTSFTPSANSIVIGNTETSSASTSFTAGSGYTLSNAACSSAYGCGEYQTGVGSATTVPFTLAASAPWAESAISFTPPTSVYYSYIWYATAGSSGADTITASFSSTVTGSVSIYEISNANPSVASSTGSSSGGSTTPSVTSFTPGANSFVIGNTETSSSSASFTAGSGFTLGGTCSSVYGCGEYQTGVSSATTVPSTLGTSAPWVESALSLGPSSYSSYIWYATAGSSGADMITASFGSTAVGSVSIYEISGATTAGALSSTGSSSAGSATPSVTAFTPSISSIVIGNAETGAPSSSFTAGSGYTLSGTCSSAYGCGEYQTGVTSLTNVPFSLGASIPWVESAVSLSPSPNTYYSYIWYTTAGSSGPDTITASFSSAVAGSVSIYDFKGYTTTGLLTSYGSSVAGSTTASVTSFTPSANSIVIGNVETPSSSTSYAPGVGYKLVNSFNCNPSYGCGEYHAGLGSTTTVPFTLSSSTPWVESAISFASGATYQSGVSVGGYPALGVPNEVSLVFRVTFTNQDPSRRSVTLWPQSALAVSFVKCSGGEDGSCGGEEGGSSIIPYYIVDGINGGVNGLIAYNSTQNFVTLAPGVKTTLYFGARTPLGSSVNTVDDELQSLFMAFFALTGQYSDKSLYGQTIPYPVGIVTGADVSTSITTGATGAVVTVTGDDFNNNAKAFIGWMDSTGKITTLTKFTTIGDDIPAGTTFQVPSASAGFYTIIVSDYSNTVFRTFQHT